MTTQTAEDIRMVVREEMQHYATKADLIDGHEARITASPKLRPGS